MSFVLHEVAQRVADGPGPADQFADRLLATEPGQSPAVIFRQAIVVPADRPAYLDAVGIDPPGGVMRGGNAPGNPVC